MLEVKHFCNSAVELVLNHNRIELFKFLVSEWEKKNTKEKVIYVTSGEKCDCLNYNQRVQAL